METTWPGARCPEPRATDLDQLFNETDRLYRVYARGCGISDCCLWVLYALTAAGSPLTQTELQRTLYYSRQTINSAIRQLEGRGLLTLADDASDRRAKRVCLTSEGVAFGERYVLPAMRAEERAFETLPEAARSELVSLARRYVEALRAELAAAGESVCDQGRCE